MGKELAPFTVSCLQSAQGALSLSIQRVLFSCWCGQSGGVGACHPLQALSIQVDEAVSVDPKKTAFQFLMQNRCRRHHFDTLQNAAHASRTPRPCMLHADQGQSGCSIFFEVTLDGGGRRSHVPADVCCIGFPCAPCSFQRAGRFLAEQWPKRTGTEGGGGVSWTCLKSSHTSDEHGSNSFGKIPTRT